MRFSKKAMEMLEGHHWPGNVRELENLVQRACVLATGNVLLPSDLPFDQSGGNEPEESVLDRAARQFLRVAAETGSSPVALAMQTLVAVAQRETDSDDKAAGLLHLSKAEILKYRDSTEKQKGK